MDRFVPSRHARPVLIHDGVDAVEFASWHMSHVLGVKSAVLTTEDARGWDKSMDVDLSDAVAHVSFAEPPSLNTLRRLVFKVGVDQVVLAYLTGEIAPTLLELCEGEYIGLFYYNIYGDVEPLTTVAHRMLEQRERGRLINDLHRHLVKQSSKGGLQGSVMPGVDPTTEDALERLRADVEARARSTINDLDELKRMLEPFTWLQQRAVHRRQPPPFPRDLVGRSNEIRTLLRKLETSDRDQRLNTQMRLEISRVFQDRLAFIDEILERELAQLGRDWDHGDALDAMQRSRAHRS